MAKPRKNSAAAANSNSTASAAAGEVGVRVKPKRTRKSVPRESPSQRSSVYRGVTRHRWTGRFEAHLWDKNSWNESQNKKGKQGQSVKPFVGLNESIKNQFWEDLDSMVSGIPISEKLFIGGDLNGHVGTSNVGFERVHGGFGYGSRNQEGVDILNWALAYDLRFVRRIQETEIEEALKRMKSGKAMGPDACANRVDHSPTDAGAYDDEDAAARAYDLAALKYWGPDTILNFPASAYEEELKEMEAQSREEYIGSLRRKSSGFSRGVSKYRGVARHHHNGRWEARIGRVFGNKYLYLGTYATQEEAAMAYDMAAIEYRGLNAVTNFDLSRYIKWLRPGADGVAAAQNPHPMLGALAQELQQVDVDGAAFHHNHGAEAHFPLPPRTSLGHTPTTSALSLLLQSPKFKEMIARTTAAESSTTSSSSPPTPSPPRPSPSPPPMQELQVQVAKDGSGASPQCSFPDDIYTDLLRV
ncbi:hypothetical protein PR202_gb22589 [Eleusine coracana subsp. coracana]|uniref:AP2/ERF domain-containing protein n=1 Tax=Eleusine coracana subsp. coracana TaxID=191504 RepID=A0AAV5FE71_ELECO|nr:hypothetical protein PR202_gb22589 [Eleusine coracana subsp. coracana]